MRKCDVCGSEIKDGGLFCSKCGAKLQNEGAKLQNEGAKLRNKGADSDVNAMFETAVFALNEADKRSAVNDEGSADGLPERTSRQNFGRSRIFFIALAVVLAAALSAGVMFLFRNRDKNTDNGDKFRNEEQISLKTIRIDDYIEIEFLGYDSYGTAAVHIDYISFYEEILAAAQRYGCKEESELKAGNLLDSVSIVVDKNEKLSNGDSVKVVADFDLGMAKEAGVVLEFDNPDLTVRGLKQLDVIDIFDYVTVFYFGVDGNVSLGYEVKKYSDILFEFDKNKKLSIGDAVTLTLKPEGEKLLAEKYKIHPSYRQKSYEITEKTVMRYVRAISEIPQDILKSLQASAEKTIKMWYDDWLTPMNGLILTERECAGMYLFTPSESKKNEGNRIVFVYTATLTFSDETALPMRIYLPVGHDNLTKKYDEYQSEDRGLLYDVKYSDNKGFYGFESEEEMFDFISADSKIKDFSLEIAGNLHDLRDFD